MPRHAPKQPKTTGRSPESSDCGLGDAQGVALTTKGIIRKDVYGATKNKDH